MAAQTVKQYGTELAYGVGDSGATISVGGFTGWLISATTSREGDSKTYKDQGGITKTLIITEQWQNLTLEVLLHKSGAGKALPKKGDVITGVPGKVFNKELTNLRVETCSVQWQNEDVARVSITAREYDF